MKNVKIELKLDSPLEVYFHEYSENYRRSHAHGQHCILDTADPRVRMAPV